MSKTPEQLEAELVDANKKADEAITKLGELKKEMQGLQGVHAGWTTEIGAFRKEAKDLIDQLKASGADPEKVQKALDKIAEFEKALNGSLENGSKGKGGKTEGEAELLVKLTDLKKNMTPEQKEIADAKFKTLSEEDRVKIRGNRVLGVKGDAKQELLFLEAAISSKPFVPDSLFDEPAQDDDEDANPYAELFAGASRRNNHLPGARKKAASGFAGSEDELVAEPSSKMNGGIPRPTPAKA